MCGSKHDEYIYHSVDSCSFPADSRSADRPLLIKQVFVGMAASLKNRILAIRDVLGQQSVPTRLAAISRAQSNALVQAIKAELANLNVEDQQSYLSDSRHTCSVFRFTI